MGVHAYCDSPCVQFQYIQIRANQKGKKGNDCGDDKHGVKEDSMSSAAKATKPGGDDSKDDDNDEDEDEDNKEVQKGGNKRGDKDDDPSAFMGTGSSLSLSDEVVM